MTDDIAEAKRQAEMLVATARALVAKAEEEAASIVEAGQQRVEGIVSDAETLREAAEADAAGMRADAERLLSASRAQADGLLAEARESRADAVEHARSALVSGPSRPSADRQEAEVVEASEIADRILRVARSEAEARSRELTENARRKADQLERDARSRVELANHEHRELVRTMQQRELQGKARVRELESQISLLERKLGRLRDDADRRGLDDDPGSPHVAEEAPSGIEFPRAEPSPTPRAAEERPVERPRPLEQRQDDGGDEVADPELARALRAIRRRA